MQMDCCQYMAQNGKNFWGVDLKHSYNDFSDIDGHTKPKTTWREGTYVVYVPERIMKRTRLDWSATVNLLRDYVRKYKETTP